MSTGKKTIYVVVSQDWMHSAQSELVCAFADKQRADNFVKKKKERRGSPFDLLWIEEIELDDRGRDGKR